MEMDLDLDDLDFGDRIKDYLEHKLKEIQTKNASIEEKISERKKQLQQTVNVQEIESRTATWNWKKYFNNKYVICYTVYNSLEKHLESIQPILKWSSSKQLSYKVIIYEKPEDSPECNKESCEKLTNELIKTNVIQSEAYVVIVINNPNFLENLDFTLCGKLLFHQEEKQNMLVLPDIQLSSKDITDRDVCDIQLTTGNMENILAALSSTEQVEVILIFSQNWNIPLDSTFEIHCCLTKLNIPSNCKKYFVANRLSQFFDNSILEIHKSNTESNEDIYSVIYFSSKSALISLLHHLHQHVPGLLVIPRQLHEHYRIKHSIDKENTSNVLQAFQDSISKELDLIESFSQSLGSKDTRKFRSDLTRLEEETDVSYLKLNEMNNYNIN